MFKQAEGDLMNSVQPSIVERLREDASHHRDVAGDCDCRPEDTVNWEHAVNCEEAANRIEDLEGALRAIMKATVEGRVCDDVAWFDSITTLHDFCDFVLNGPEAGA